MKILVQEIISRAKIFLERFSGTPFLIDEPVHEFTGIEFRDPDTSLVSESVSYRLIIRGASIGIFSTEEIPIDEMYDIRFVIAESQMPEYQ